MSSDSKARLQGTLAILVPRALLGGPAHGYGVACWIEATSADVLHIEEGSLEEGSLYPALRRVEDRGWVTSAWGLSENDRRACACRPGPRSRCATPPPSRACSAPSPGWPDG